MWITKDSQRLVSRRFSWRNKTHTVLRSLLRGLWHSSMCLDVVTLWHNLTPKQLFKYTSYHLIFYLRESLADFLGLELTAEMFELSVRKFSLSDDVLWRLLPAPLSKCLDLGKNFRQCGSWTYNNGDLEWPLSNIRTCLMIPYYKLYV